MSAETNSQETGPTHDIALQDSSEGAEQRPLEVCECCRISRSDESNARRIVIIVQHRRMPNDTERPRLPDVQHRDTTYRISAEMLSKQNWLKRGLLGFFAISPKMVVK